MVSKLELYIRNSDDTITPFPSEAEQIVLYDFSFEAQRMGEAPEITASIQADGLLEKRLTTKVFCEHNGERYYLKNLPESSKDNTDPRYTFELTFVSERTILDNTYMIDAVQGDNSMDGYQSNSTIVVFAGTIVEMVARLNAALSYAEIDYSVVLDSGITSETKLVSFQDKYFTEALQEGFKIFGIPYYFVGKVVHFGWAQNTIPTLKYGDGLLSISKSLRSDRIINRLTGTGSSENIPYYYPNPTPKGYLQLYNPNGLDAWVESQLKLSKIPDGGHIEYFSTREKVEIPVQYAEWTDPDSRQIMRPVGSSFILTNGYPSPIVESERVGMGTDLCCEIRVTHNQPKLSVKLKCDVVFQKDLSDENNAAAISGCSIKGTAVDGTDISYSENGHGLSMDLQYAPDDVGNMHNSITISSKLPSGVYTVKLYARKNTLSGNYINGSFVYNTLQFGKEAGWYLINSLGEESSYPVLLRDYGITSLSATEGDVLSYNVDKKIPFATTLMPPIYRDDYGVKRFYDAVNGAYEGVVFENEYSPNERKEGIVSFPDIKPTIVGVTYNGERIDMFSAFAYDTTDSDETESKEEDSVDYVHPYFYAKLRKLDFNLFEQAIESGEMMVEMTSGHCGACKFTIMVDKNTQRNLVMVDHDGNLIYDESTGRVKMADDATGLDRQNNTRSYEVWVALKKDINTFGQVMPNVKSNLYPSTEDTFVLTNILLPESYITSAEKKLEEAIIKSLVENNSYKYDFNIDFSRIYLQQNKVIAKQITENSSLNLVYNNKEYLFYISSYTYRKQKDELLPQIEVSLETSFESAPSAFQQMINSIQESASQSASVNESVTDARYLRKNVPDTARDVVTFEKGLVFNGSVQTTDFVRGDFAGKGFAIYTDENGNRVIEADRAIFRQDVSFAEIVINQVKFQAGVNVFSSGGCVITNVEEIDDAYRCYYDNKFGTRYAGFVEGDQAQCRRFDENFGDNNDTVTKYYWRLVTNVGSNYIDLSISDASGEGVPQIGDEIVQLGHRTDPTRQNAIVIASTPTPTILQYVGINSYVLPEPVTKISPDDNVFTGKVHIGAGSTGVENLEGIPEAIQEAMSGVEISRYNLLRNSGFEGDYTTAELNDKTPLNSDSAMFSPRLKYWNTIGDVKVVPNNESTSGYAVEMISAAWLIQTLDAPLIKGEHYILSFKGKGTKVLCGVGDDFATIELGDANDVHSYSFQASSESNTFGLQCVQDDNATICELQLERGDIRTAWGRSFLDNSKEQAAVEAIKYLSNAIKEGSTDIIGGLILSNMIMLGNYVNGTMEKVTAGMSGTYVDNKSVAFWGGGTYEDAIRTVARLMSGNNEWTDDMANFVVTHGGDIFLKGYINALGGIFRGAVEIAEGKILLNADGSGHLAAGKYSWNEKGVTKMSYPNMIEWVNFSEIVNGTDISLDSGGYIGNVCSSEEDIEYKMPSKVEIGLSICLRAPHAVSRNTTSATIWSVIPFRAFVKDESNPYGGSYQTGNYLYINAHTIDKPIISITYDGLYWQIETDGSIGTTENGDSTKNITIWQ